MLKASTWSHTARRVVVVGHGLTLKGDAPSRAYGERPEASKPVRSTRVRVCADGERGVRAST
jgi:hypothetical protein